ncbi:hypothetical protein HY251_06575 [bacterium]|nr:hypothetical protein [bacterium]
MAEAPPRSGVDERIFHEIAQLVVDVAARAQACAAQRRIAQTEVEEVQRLVALALRALEERRGH